MNGHIRIGYHVFPVTNIRILPEGHDTELDRPGLACLVASRTVVLVCYYCKGRGWRRRRRKRYPRFGPCKHCFGTGVGAPLRRDPPVHIEQEIPELDRRMLSIFLTGKESE